jgi:hypothetical protein
MMIFKLKIYLYMAKNLIYNLRNIFFSILKFKLPFKKIELHYLLSYPSILLDELGRNYLDKKFL